MIIKLDNGAEADRVPSGSVCVLGFFDGVHMGHRRLFETAAEVHADNITAWTFSHLTKDIRGTLTTNEEKIALLRECGASYAVFENFDTVRDMDGETFFEKVIVNSLSPSAVVCGYNFRFGKGASCTADDLARFASERGIGCIIVPEYLENGVSVSSSTIRSDIVSGNVDSAASLLGHLYSIDGEVVHGFERGRTIGYPTMNLRIPCGKVSPAEGVYASLVTFEGEEGIYGGVCSLGSRPTVNNDTTDITLETHIFDLSRDLYGMKARVHFCRMIRKNMKFPSLTELKEQLNRDSEEARRIISMTPYRMTYSGFIVIR